MINRYYYYTFLKAALEGRGFRPKFLVRYYDEPTRETFEGIIIGIRYYVPAPGEISNGSWEYDVLTGFHEGRMHNISAAFENDLTKLSDETGPSLN